MLAFSAGLYDSQREMVRISWKVVENMVYAVYVMLTCVTTIPLSYSRKDDYIVKTNAKIKENGSCNQRWNFIGTIISNEHHTQAKVPK